MCSSDLGEGASGLYVSGFKGYTGHTMGACGPMELAFTLYMMQEGFLAPTLNLDAVDPRCANAEAYPPGLAGSPRIAAIQNFAFGGVNTCLLVKKGPDVC